MAIILGFQSTRYTPDFATWSVSRVTTDLSKLKLIRTMNGVAIRCLFTSFKARTRSHVEGSRARLHNGHLGSLALASYAIALAIDCDVSNCNECVSGAASVSHHPESLVVRSPVVDPRPHRATREKRALQLFLIGRIFWESLIEVHDIYLLGSVSLSTWY